MPTRSLPHAWTRVLASAVLAAIAGATFGAPGAPAQSSAPGERVGVRAPAVTVVGGVPVESTSPVLVPTIPPTAPPTAPPTVPVTAPPPTTSTTSTTAASSTTATTAVRATTSTAAGSTTTAAPRTTAELRERIRAALAASTAKQRSVYVVADGIGPVYEENADVSLPPASAQKVVVGGTALLELGADHRFVTVVRADGPVVDGVLQGDLVLVASGDPSLTSTNLLELAGGVAAAGVKSVTGDLVVDDSRFDLARGNAGWKASFQPGEVGTLSALLVDGNKRGDAATRADPGMANLVRFRQYLTRRKVAVAGINRRSTAGASMPVLTSHRSAPLPTLVSHMLKKSDNTYAEAILKEIGASAGAGSTSGGVAVVDRVFDRFGLSRSVLGDGSGLSSANRASARRLVGWLSRLDGSPVGATLRSSLAVACVDGTLRSRMCKTPASGVVTAKTGALDYVVTIAGFTRTTSGRTAVYSVLLSGVGSSARGRAAIDQALVALTSFAG